MQADDEQDPTVLEAIKWFVRLRDERSTDEDRREFEEWLHRDPSHQRAWERANELWDRFDLAKSETREVQARVSRRNALLWLGILAVAASGTAYWFGHPELLADYTTTTGERRRITLEDGTDVELGPQSALATRFDPTVRRVRLLAGEAFFVTGHDDDRPFIVQAGQGEVRALGTRFNVKIAGDRVTTAVAEKAVLINAGHSPAVRIMQGFQVYFDAGGVGQIAKADLDVITAWRHDRLIFQDAPLGKVVEELGRYRQGKTVILNRDLAEMPVTGSFDMKKADQALRTIAQTLSLRLFWATDYLVVITRG